MLLERIKVKVKVCLPTDCIFYGYSEPYIKLSSKRRSSQLHPKCMEMAGEYRDAFVHKQFVIIVSSLDRLLSVKLTVQGMYQKMYPEENPVCVRRFRDSQNCDLDDDFLVGEVLDADDCLLAVCDYDVSMKECRARKAAVQSLGFPDPQTDSLPSARPTVDRCVMTPVSVLGDAHENELLPHSCPVDQKVGIEPAAPSTSSNHATTMPRVSGVTDSAPLLAPQVSEGTDSAPLLAPRVSEGTDSAPLLAPRVSEGTDSVPLLVSPPVAVAVSECSLSGSSEYETDSNSESESDTGSEGDKECTASVEAPPAQATAIQSTNAPTTVDEVEETSDDAEEDKDELVQKSSGAEQESNGVLQPKASDIASDCPSSEGSDFKPAPLLKPPPLNTPPVPRHSDKKYGSHLFSARHTTGVGNVDGKN